jgi:hypothetical protein
MAKLCSQGYLLPPSSGWWSHYVNRPELNHERGMYCAKVATEKVRKNIFGGVNMSGYPALQRRRVKPRNAPREEQPSRPKHLVSSGHASELRKLRTYCSSYTSNTKKRNKTWEQFTLLNSFPLMAESRQNPASEVWSLNRAHDEFTTYIPMGTGRQTQAPCYFGPMS